MANEKRIRKAFQHGTLGSTLLVGGTTIDFGSAPGFATLDSDEHIALILDPEGVNGAPEVVYITSYTATNTTATITRGQEGTSAREHPSGTAWAHGPTLRDQSYGRVDYVKYTGGNITINGGWTNLHTSTDLTVRAQPGDILEVSLNAMSGSSNHLALNAATWDGSSLVSFFGSGEPTSTTGDGVMGWTGFNNINAPIGGSVMMEVSASDIVGGLCTVRFRARSSGSKTINATANAPLLVHLKNHGPREA